MSSSLPFSRGEKDARAVPRRLTPLKGQGFPALGQHPGRGDHAPTGIGRKHYLLTIDK
jgi:hypothetical protein